MNEKDVKKGDILYYDDIVPIFNTVFSELGLNDWSVNKSINIAKNGVKVLNVMRFWLILILRELSLNS